MKRRSIKSTTPGLSSCEVLPAFRSYKEVSWQNGQGLDQFARFSLILVASALKALSWVQKFVTAQALGVLREM